MRGVVLVEDTADAIALAGDTRFGIGVSIFGGTRVDHRCVGEAVRVARLLINESPLYQDPYLVVGGVGDSGYGGARPKLEQLVYARRVHRAGRAIELTAKEFALLEVFVRHADQVLDRAAITAHVWDENHDPFTNVLEVLVRRLRRKIDDDFEPKLIHTLRGAGYRFGR
ncbi:MAG: hypothetical protein B7Z72_00735 [Gemmatimonadetes bacterium 21-71-4]|nr:MAG: hypothetical protein B7Z72_00735 [Gemmatimonadetes bacterium 21-71-4]